MAVQKPITAAIVAISDLRALSAESLIITMKESALKQTSQHIALGKMIVVLDEGRDEEKHKTLKGYVRKLLGLEIEPASYKCAKAFSIVGEGHGTITEPHYDACKLNWLLTVSAILGFLEKHPADVGARTRESVAIILRAPNKATDAALKAIKDDLKPEAGKTDEDEKEKDKPEAEALDFTNAETLRSLMRSIHGAIATCGAEALAVIYKGSVALCDYSAETMTAENFAKVKAELDGIAATVAA